MFPRLCQPEFIPLFAVRLSSAVGRRVLRCVIDLHFTAARRLGTTRYLGIQRGDGLEQFFLAQTNLTRGLLMQNAMA